MHKLPKLAALAAMAGLLSACGGAASQSVPTTPQNYSNAPSSGAPGAAPASNVVVQNGMTLVTMPTLGSSFYTGVRSMAHGTTSSGNLLYGGGPVQTTPHIFVVYWGPKWTTSDPEYTTLNGFFNAIGGGGWINIDTQYYQTLGGVTTYIGNPSGQLTSTWIDSSSVPNKPSSSQVGAEAQKAEQHFAAAGYAYSVNNNYFVAIQSGNDPTGFKTRWCAWHSSESESEGTLSFTDFPYQSDAGTSCGAGSVNSPGTYDGVSIVGGHEEAETQTDPQPSTGWVDSSGSEIGDKCAWIDLENNPNAGGYPTQPLWDNKISGCAQSGP